FFITTGAPHFLDYDYTLFGQLVSGQDTVTKMAQVPVVLSSVYNDTVKPAHPLVIETASVSTTNPNGAVIIDTSQAHQGDTATFMVTATNPTDGSTTSQSFTVTVGAYAGPTLPAINFRPYANPMSATVPSNGSTTVSLAGQSGYPSTSQSSTLSYALTSQ